MLKKSLYIAGLCSFAAFMSPAENITTSLGTFEALPQAFIYESPVSQSQWLWDGEQPVKDGAESYFRLTVSLSEKISSAFLNVYFDDLGELFVNGKKTAGHKIGNELKIGKNLFAFHLKNGASASGLLFYGEIKLASGKTVFLHSDKNVKASSTLQENWQNPGFDDKTWNSAILQGDVMAAPWSIWSEYVSRFTSPQEKARINAAEEKAFRLPETIAGEPDANARVVYNGYSPQILVNGRKIAPIINLSSPGNVLDDSATIKFYNSGIRIFQIGIGESFFWKAPGKYDFSGLNKQAARILSLAPEANLMIMWRSGALKKWCEENPDECISYGTGPITPGMHDERIARVLRPSAASEKYRRETVQQVLALAEYVKKQPWGKRVIGFRVAYGIYSEWHTYGMYEAPDTGIRMTETFRRYLTKKYKNDSGLQKAWGQKGVTLKNAKVPGPEARWHSGNLLLDPARDRAVLDYYDCHVNVQADFLLELAKNMKSVFPNKLCGAYYGYVFTKHPPEGANILLDKVLSSPYIDYLSDPADYTSETRLAGGDFSNRTITATHRRYGKLSLLEDDTRFHHSLKYIGKSSPITRNTAESNAVIRRNFCNMFFNGTGVQINDPSSGKFLRPHLFDEPGVMKNLKQTIDILDKLGSVPKASGNDTAVVLDYREVLKSDGYAWKTSSLVRNIYGLGQQHLNKSGIAYDIMTLQDFLSAKQDYKVVVFMNIFNPSKKERNAIKEKLRKPGKTAVWLVAPGSVTENGFSDRAMSDLTGIQLIGAGAKPKVKSADPQARKYDDLYIMKKLADGSQAIFCPDAPRSCQDWNIILKMAGSYVFTEPGNYFRKHGNVFMLHTAGTDNCKITLPQNAGKVTELFSGRQFPVSNINLSASQPETWLFKVE